jgi:hypothetical protein
LASNLAFSGVSAWRSPSCPNTSFSKTLPATRSQSDQKPTRCWLAPQRRRWYQRRGAS